MISVKNLNSRMYLTPPAPRCKCVQIYYQHASRRLCLARSSEESLAFTLSLSSLVWRVCPNPSATKDTCDIVRMRIMQFLARSLAKLGKFSAGASLCFACREAKGCAEAGRRRAGAENFSLTRTMRKTDSGSSKAPPTCAASKSLSALFKFLYASASATELVN